jgi:signal peptidase I
LLAVSAAVLLFWIPLVLYHGVSGSDSFYGWYFHVVTTDSMTDTIQPGALVVGQAVPFSELEEGDVITFRLPDGSHNTHRIAAKEPGAAWTKGDNLSERDPIPVTEKTYLCKTRWIWNGFAVVVGHRFSAGGGEALRRVTQTALLLLGAAGAGAWAGHRRGRTPPRQALPGETRKRPQKRRRDSALPGWGRKLLREIDRAPLSKADLVWIEKFLNGEAF